ncbi:dermonecrotic toxin domain-containing protein [Pseudomonas mandelii]|uniref:dermonecrotic toxin domain-containing protein n=1 Tax=Pseudomonas mandelii TaxID=75612 RepID=UPI0020A1C181|nr:DUF6543 domain-containing protein [Pseudomonas mandelii]MCO8314330.1 hypothetical protein [Pseudomonas mandelii]
MEFNKEAEGASLRELGEALENISQELKRIPSFRVILQDALRDELWKVSEGTRLSSLVVNVVAGATPLKKEPLGRLLDVVMECLQSGRVPNYDANTYGVFDHPSFTSPEDIIAEIPISAIEMLVADVLKKLPVYYTSAVQQYWESPTVQKEGGAYPQLTRKSALGVLEAILFNRELDALAIQSVITQQERALIGTTLQAGLTGTCYGVFIEAQNGKYIEQNSMFVVPLKAPVYEQLVSGEQGAVVLYCASRGIEVFSSCSELEQTLLSRLGSPDTQEEFLQAVPLSERAGFAFVPAVRFLKVRANLFERFAQKRLHTMYSDVTWHMESIGKPGSDLDKTVVTVESVQSLSGILDQAKQRQAQLLKRVEQNAWPQWLKNTSEVNQEVYVSLQKLLLEAEVKHHETTDGIASMKDYARLAVEDFLSPSADERVNPDNIFVKIVHTVPLANGQKVELSESKTLTQAFMQGGHDEAGQYRIILEEFTNHPKLTPANIMRSIRDFNIRVSYGSALRTIYSRPEVAESMREVFGRKTALSMFSAILQRHVSPNAQDLVTRYNLGDPSIESMGVHLRGRIKPFRSLLVYRRKGPDAARGAHVIHTPEFPTGQEWHEFADLKKLRHAIARWVFDPRLWTYLKAQSYASDSAEVENSYLAHNPHEMLKEWWWSYIELRGFSEDGPLKGAVQNYIVWDVDQANVVTPQWYAKAKTSDQRLLNRLNSDSKALYHHSKDMLDIQPFKEFSRKLVAKELSGYLNRSGTSVEINPDEVWVEFHADSKISLTELFIQWQLWSSDINAFVKFFSWVRPGAAHLIALKEELRTASFWTFTNQPIAQLNASVINDLIDLKPGEKYLQYLREKFLDAPDVGLKINLYRKTKQNEMLRAALVQKIKGELSQNQFDWLQGLINGFDQDLPREGVITVGGKPGIGVYELTLQGRAITGAYVFGRNVNGRDEFMVYVPNTLDGKDFFPIAELASRLASHECRSAVMSLVRLEHMEAVKSLVDSYWTVRPLVTTTPELTNSYRIRSFSNQYKERIGQIIADVDFQTTSSWEAFWKDARILAEFALDLASMFIPPLGLALTVLRITHSVVQGVVATSLGLDDAANAHFASAWRGAIMLYVGKVGAIGAPVNPLALLSNVRDFADVMTAVTGVEVGINYVTAVTTPPSVVNSTTRLLN